MRRFLILPATVAALLALTPPAVMAEEIEQIVTAKDLLLPCQEADNDPRDGYLSLLECTQFIRGFLAGVETASGEALPFCLPETNRDDATRRSFVHWVHGSFGKRSKMPAGTALQAALTEAFACK